MSFLVWKYMNFEWYFTEFCPQGSINNIPALIQMMAWGRPYSDGKITDAYMHHTASVS